MRAKFRDSKEFEAVLKNIPLHLFSTSGSAKYGATWKRYKSGDPTEDHRGDLSVILRNQAVTERIDNRVSRYDENIGIYKRISCFAKFKVTVTDEASMFGDRFATLFEIAVEWDYIAGTDPI